MKNRILATILTLAIVVSLAPSAFAKTSFAGQTVGNVLFYITNAKGEQILVSQLPVSQMETVMLAGLIDDVNHNYSLLDKFTTTLHQEGKGFTVPEFIKYAQDNTPIESLKALTLELSGKTTVRFWEIDGSGFDDKDNYTYGDLYEVPRYNFPLLYEYWDYENQDYYDPNGKMSRSEVIDYIFANGEPEVSILAVRAFSQRYMVTTEKFQTDYNLQNYWQDSGRMDNQRALRVMKPMTKDELYNKTPTAMDTRSCTANILLEIENAPDIAALGTVAIPTAKMTDYGDNFYVYLQTATPGATILFNHNFDSPSYTPTSPYGDGAIVIPKSYAKSGEITLTVHAVKEGYTDAGVITLKLKSSGTESNPVSGISFSDVEPGVWYENAVIYAMEKKLFDVSGNKFEPKVPTTRGELVTALYRLEGSPEVTKFATFSDVTKGTPLSAAISWANANDIVTGSDDKFTPEKNISREQIAVLFYNYAKYKGTVKSTTADLSVFTDSGDIVGYATTGLSWAIANGIFTGSDGKINPKGTSTRAGVAQIIYNYTK
jgi:hypothetical protein